MVVNKWRAGQGCMHRSVRQRWHVRDSGMTTEDHVTVGKWQYLCWASKGISSDGCQRARNFSPADLPEPCDLWVSIAEVRVGKACPSDFSVPSSMDSSFPCLSQIPEALDSLENNYFQKEGLGGAQARHLELGEPGSNSSILKLTLGKLLSSSSVSLLVKCNPPLLNVSN